MHAGGLQVGRVPEDDSTGDEVERARPMGLGLQGVIADVADPVEEDGAFQCIFGLTLVEFAGCAAPLFWLLDPVECKQGALDAADLAPCQGQAIGPWIGAEPFQHDRCTHDAGADRGAQAQHVVPVCGDQGLVDPARDQRRDIWARFDSVEQVKPARGDVREGGHETTERRRLTQNIAANCQEMEKRSPRALLEPDVWTGTVNTDVLGALREKRAETHRGSRRRNIGPLKKPDIRQQS